MKNGIIQKPGESGRMDLTEFFILMIAGIVSLYIAFPDYMGAIYGGFLVIPCTLFLGVMLERGRIFICKKTYILPLAMAAWFLILQMKRGIEHGELYNMGLFLCTYLFAFPLASLLQDGEGKKALKVFAGAYLAADTALTTMGLLLVLDCLPEFLSEHIFWDNALLNLFWHSNITACFLMIGTVFCIMFLEQAKKPWSRFACCILLIMMLGAMALTSCRTIIVLTGVFLGSILFFEGIKRGRKWFLPGVLAVLVVTVAFYKGAEWLHQAQFNAQLQKVTQQYSGQTASDDSESATSEAEISVEETDEYADTDAISDAQKDSLPIAANPDTSEVNLKDYSGKGSFLHALDTLTGRINIWRSACFAFLESRSIQCWGIPNPGEYVSHYYSSPIAHLHNAWMECLLGMGYVGFLIAMLFTLLTLWNCMILLLKHYRDFWKRNVAILTLCLMGTAVMEAYLFYTRIPYHPINLLFFLCAGYLAYWQKEDNAHILAVIQRRISSFKK